MNGTTRLRVAFSESDGGFSRLAYAHTGHELEWRAELAGEGKAAKSKMVIRFNEAGSRDERTRSSVTGALAALRNSDADLALVPMTNTVCGFHPETVTELARGGLEILAEFERPIEHALVTSLAALRSATQDSDVQARLAEFRPAQELSKSFVHHLFEVYGHPWSFEQCLGVLLSEGLPRRDRHRWQPDPVRTVSNIVEYLSSAATPATNAPFPGGQLLGGAQPIYVPGVTAPAPTTQSAPSRGPSAVMLGVPMLSQFVAALAPKGLYPRGFDDWRGESIAPDHLRDQMIELSHPYLEELDAIGNTTRFIWVARTGDERIKALRGLFAQTHHCGEAPVDPERQTQYYRLGPGGTRIKRDVLRNERQKITFVIRIPSEVHLHRTIEAFWQQLPASLRGTFRAFPLAPIIHRTNGDVTVIQDLELSCSHTGKGRGSPITPDDLRKEIKHAFQGGEKEKRFKLDGFSVYLAFADRFGDVEPLTKKPGDTHGKDAVSGLTPPPGAGQGAGLFFFGLVLGVAGAFGLHAGLQNLPCGQIPVPQVESVLQGMGYLQGCPQQAAALDLETIQPTAKPEQP